MRAAHPPQPEPPPWRRPPSPPPRGGGGGPPPPPQPDPPQWRRRSSPPTGGAGWAVLRRASFRLDPNGGRPSASETTAARERGRPPPLRAVSIGVLQRRGRQGGYLPAAPRRARRERRAGVCA